VRFLIVEDEAGPVILMRRLLRPFASEIEDCGALQRALELCRARQFDIIVLDLKLTDSSPENTLSVVRRFMQLQRECGIVVCSGLPDADLRHKSMSAGASGFIDKSAAMWDHGGQQFLRAVVAAVVHRDAAHHTPTFLEHVRDLEACAYLT
jgi:CheY-like chemotaxis protein